MQTKRLFQGSARAWLLAGSALVLLAGLALCARPGRIDVPSHWGGDLFGEDRAPDGTAADHYAG